MYVQRDKSGKITGVYANPQPQPDGTCLTEAEPLGDDDPEVVAYLNPPPRPQSISDGQLAALLIDKKLLTPQDVSVAIAAKADLPDAAV